MKELERIRETFDFEHTASFDKNGNIKRLIVNLDLREQLGLDKDKWYTKNKIKRKLLKNSNLPFEIMKDIQELFSDNIYSSCYPTEIGVEYCIEYKIGTSYLIQVGVDGDNLIVEVDWDKDGLQEFNPFLIAKSKGDLVVNILPQEYDNKYFENEYNCDYYSFSKEELKNVIDSFEMDILMDI